jgi:hypothetical protein
VACGRFGNDAERKKFELSGSPQDLHGPSTVFAQSHVAAMIGGS